MNKFFVDISLILLLSLSVISWVIVINKYLVAKKRVAEVKLFNAIFWKAEGWNAASEKIAGMNSDFAILAKVGFSVFDEYLANPYTLSNAGEINEVLERPLRQKAEEIIRAHERGLSELASIGSLSPFIGLFGTVLGIMGALHTISTAGQASIDVVAGPIGEALIATAIGIATALPAVYFFNYFNRRTRLAITDIEGFINDFLRLAVREIKNRKER